MSRKNRFISKLRKKEKKELTDGWQNGKSSAFRKRCHAILLSERGFTSNEIAEFYDVKLNTIYNWFNRWEGGGYELLKTQPGQGRKAILCSDNKEHVKVVKKAIKNRAEKGTNFLLQIQEELELEDELTMKMLRPFLKKLVTSGSYSGEG